MLFNIYYRKVKNCRTHGFTRLGKPKMCRVCGLPARWDSICHYRYYYYYAHLEQEVAKAGLNATANITQSIPIEVIK